MPIGKIIGGGLSLVGGLISDKSSDKAAQRAADTSLQVASQNNALAVQNRDMLLSRADPYVSSGMGANALLNDFYGISSGGQSMPTAQPMQAQFMGGGQNALMASKPWLSSGFGGNPGPNGMPNAGVGGGTFNIGGQQPNALAANSGDAFRRYINNSDYAFQLGEGSNDINSGYAGAGVLQSGDAMRKLEEYRQNLQSGYRNEWASGVSGQQGAGLNALGAAAGVSTNYVNQASNNNNNAGTAQANAQLVAGQNNPFANALGMAGGFMLGR